jgi:UbiD family decarboxylase
MAFNNLRSHLQQLESQGDLVRIKREINKDTELHPLVRWQFRGLPESERRAFLFENVVDSRGKRYSIPVVVGGLAASERIYATGIGGSDIDPAKVWSSAFNNPVRPRLVDSGPAQEVVYKGDALQKSGGLDALPIPISTPGFDNAPYIGSAVWIVKDPETGIRNLGVYRAQVKSPFKTGLFTDPKNNFTAIWEKCNARGIPMEVAAVIGASPSVYFSAIQVAPMGVDELDLAGALQGEPVELVKCQTIDLEVPAYAEIVIEGTIRTDVLEPEGSFGEAHGYSDPRSISFVFDVSCITHRRDPIYLSIISQVTPSESSKCKQRGYEAGYLHHLREKFGLKGVLEVALTEDLLNRQFAVVRMNKQSVEEPMKALQALMELRQLPKVAVAVDEDIDPRDPIAVNWAIVNRSQPHRDLQIVKPTPLPFGPLRYVKDPGYDDFDSAILIDATKKAPLPPVALPAKKYMEHARGLWEELGLPALTPKSPWHGYSLGLWPDENALEAELATQGRYYETGTKLAERQLSVEPGSIIADVRKKK